MITRSSAYTHRPCRNVLPREGRGELEEHQAHVLLAACDAPRACSGAVFEDYLVRKRFEGGPVVTLAAGVQGGLGPVEVGVVMRCGVR
jgi:hypothetical protein